MEYQEDIYTHGPRAKKFSFIMLGLGLLLTILGIVFDHGDHLGNRVWSNVLINGFYFMGAALGATFFMAMQYCAEVSWSVVLKRVFEAVSSFLPIGIGILFLVFIAGAFFHWHHIYHWMDADAVAHDPLLKHKEPYLNIGFFFLRAVVFVAGWIWFRNWFRKKSIEEDMQGGTAIYWKKFAVSAGFLVFFGYTSMVAVWDWIMSIDTHWFSTLFGWYVFSGIWISGMLAITLVVTYLKASGHLKYVNDSHVHDLGKWVFAISFLWSYLWFCQFMLIWYSNIPEEVTYYMARFEDYRGLFFTMFLMNMVIPMIVLMAAPAKKMLGLVAGVSVILFVTHWIDAYMLVTPGVMKEHGHFGLVEWGMFIAFIGLFSFVVLKALTKAPLLVKNHPFLEESLHFHQ